MESMAKIGFFTDTYLPVIHGVTVSLETFRKSLEDLGHEVFIFAPRHHGYTDENPRVYRFRSIRVIRKPKMYFAFPFLPINHFRKITDIKLDIVHSHTPFSMGFLGKALAYYQKLPFIYTHHTHYPEYVKVYAKEKFLIPYLAKTLIKKHSNISNAVLAPSHKIKRELRSYGVKKPIYVLPTGVNQSIFKKSPENRQILRRELGISSKTKVLLFVGRMAKEKNLEFLIKMFREILNGKSNVLMLMVGDGPHLKNLYRIAKNLNLMKNIRFMGLISRETMPTFYQVADIFVFPSLTDTQGLVILEAIACGLPVVALKDDVLQEMVIDNKNGFLIEKSSAAIFAGQVLKILDDASLYERFSENSLKISRNFSNKNQAEKLLDIYKAALNSPVFKNTKNAREKIIY